MNLLLVRHQTVRKYLGIETKHSRNAPQARRVTRLAGPLGIKRMPRRAVSCTPLMCTSSDLVIWAFSRRLLRKTLIARPPPNWRRSCQRWSDFAERRRANARKNNHIPIDDQDSKAATEEWTGLCRGTNHTSDLRVTAHLASLEPSHTLQRPSHLQPLRVPHSAVALSLTHNLLTLAIIRICSL